MYKRTLSMCFLFLILFFLAACSDKITNPTSQLTLSITGLQSISPVAKYETWLIVDGTPVSVGKFTVNSDGVLSTTAYTIEKEILDAATGCFISIEESPDPSPDHSDYIILAGDFVTPTDSTHFNNAPLSIDHHMALNNNFSTVTGKFILSTPTDVNTLNETSGVWFMNISAGYPTPGLYLPTLPDHWKYEAWATLDEQHTVSMGKFTVANQPDESAPYSGTTYPPPLCPGEDFVNQALLDSMGILTPVILSGKIIFVTVQPDASFMRTPFFLSVLKHSILGNAAPHLTYTMANQAAVSSPRGIAYRN